MIDHNLTLKIKRWLEAESHTDRLDIIEGATMLLQLNRNMALYNTILRNPGRYVTKIQYELKKFLPIRLNQMTMDDVNKMEAEVLPEVKAAIDAEPANAEEENIFPLSKGMRADHDDLPELVKSIWPQNAQRWKKIKELFNTCLSLEMPCDRYEYVTALKELWYKYKAEFDRYDSYVIPTDDEGSTADPAAVALQLSKDITNAQKYVSGEVDKLVKLCKAALADDATEKDVAKYQTKLQKMNERVLILLVNKVEITDALKAKLNEGGIIIPADNAESEETDTDNSATAE